jgi:hypothetical protein
MAGSGLKRNVSENKEKCWEVVTTVTRKFTNKNIITVMMQYFQPYTMHAFPAV